ncbi:hypothetical protein BDW22DRAFT_1430390 [Trametopsis cervina]|nr:hypothetical protein BDW22DRAFT_1430390 [Trametopsis cervina]
MLRTTRRGNAKGQPNYRVLAGLEVEGQPSRRTPQEVAAAQAEAEIHRNATAAKKQAILHRISELEDKADHAVTMGSKTRTQDDADYQPPMLGSSDDDEAVASPHSDRKKLTRSEQTLRTNGHGLAAARDALRKRKTPAQLGLPTADDSTGQPLTASKRMKTSKAPSTGLQPGWVPSSRPSNDQLKYPGAATSKPPGRLRRHEVQTSVVNIDVGRSTSVHSGKAVAGVKSAMIPRISITHSTEDHDVPSSALRRANGSKKFTNGDLPIPHYRMVLQELCDEKISELGIEINPREACYDVAMQRVYEWRSGIAKAAITAVAEFFENNKENLPTPDHRAEHVRRQLGPGLPFRYAHVEIHSEEQPIYRGLFQSTLVIQTLAYHFGSSGHLTPYNDFPFGALALVTAAVERALCAWDSGDFQKPTKNFSQETFGRRTCSYLKTIIDLKETTWTKICTAAEELAHAQAKLLAGDFDADADLSSEDERAIAVEDSD